MTTARNSSGEIRLGRQQAAASGVSHGLEAAVHAELSEKILDVVPNGRRAHAEPLGRDTRVDARGEQAEHLELARRQRARSARQVVFDSARALRRGRIPEEMDHERPLAIPRRQGERADVEGDRLASFRPRRQIEAPGALFGRREDLTFRPACGAATELAALKHFTGMTPDSLDWGVSEQPLGRPIPEQDTSIRAYCEGTVTGFAQRLIQSAFLEPLHTRSPCLA